jgi:hypothetical protein
MDTDNREPELAATQDHEAADQQITPVGLIFISFLIYSFHSPTFDLSILFLENRDLTLLW